MMANAADTATSSQPKLRSSRDATRSVRPCFSRGTVQAYVVLAISLPVKSVITVIGISGSTRRGSFNAALLRALAQAAPEGAEVRIESIAEIPLYNGDEETAHGVPAPWRA